MNRKNKFGLASIILLGINSIIGSGIFLMPGKAYALAGTSSLFVYLFVTLLAGSIAMCFAEAAGLFTSNGSAYVYTKKAFGNFAGFEVGMMKYIVQVIAWATMSVGFVTALSAAIPQVASGFWHTFTILAVILGLTIMNLAGIDVVKHVNNVATVGKLVPLVIFIAVGLFFVQGGNFQPIVPAKLDSTDFSQAAILIFYAFTGFEALATAAEDMDNPKRNIPIAIGVSMVFVALVYFLVQFVSIGVLGTKLADTDVPVVTAIGSFMGQGGMALVTAGTLISIGGINIAASFHTPRGCVALAEQNMLPGVIMKKSDRGVPYVAIILTAALTIPIALSGSFVYLATISVISRFAQYIPTCLAVIKFRKKGMKSTLRLPLGYTIPLIATAVSLWLLVHAEPQKIVIGLGAMVVIVPLYFVMKGYNAKRNLTFKDIPDDTEGEIQAEVQD